MVSIADEIAFTVFGCGDSHILLWFCIILRIQRVGYICQETFVVLIDLQKSPLVIDEAVRITCYRMVVVIDIGINKRFFCSFAIFQTSRCTELEVIDICITSQWRSDFPCFASIVIIVDEYIFRYIPVRISNTSQFCSGFRNCQFVRRHSVSKEDERTCIFVSRCDTCATGSQICDIFVASFRCFLLSSRGINCAAVSHLECTVHN